MKQNKNYSYNLHSLCKGCKLCVKGKKSVIYITGLCPRRCYYCPLSDNKRFKDVIYANERPIKNIKEIFEEVRISKSTGAGITGGDPLLKLDRTCFAIKGMKKRFGKRFHIHLYTSFDLVDDKTLKKLYNAGLDEIRFHPDLDDDKLWDRISLAKRYDWKIGVEIPAIPGYYSKIMKMVNVISGNIDFLNINELEISDTNGNKLGEKGFVCKDEYSYAIKGSHELALKIISKIKKDIPKLPVHYCTSTLKDRVQLGNRLKIRAKSIKKPYEVVDDEGMLIKGIIDDKCVKKDYSLIIRKLKNEFKISSKMIGYDKEKEQIVINPLILMEIHESIQLKCAILKEYPTWDRMIVELDPLNE